MFMLNSNKPIKVAHLQKLANQSMLNGTLMIEMVNNSFSESKKKLVIFDKARNALIKKIEIWAVKKYISTRFRLISILFRRAKEQQNCQYIDQTSGRR